jgi:hypothetical protein
MKQNEKFTFSTTVAREGKKNCKEVGFCEIFLFSVRQTRNKEHLFRKSAKKKN